MNLIFTFRLNSQRVNLLVAGAEAGAAIGGYAGGPVGMAVGTVIGASAPIVEGSYDKVSTELRHSFNGFINSLTSGWMQFR